MRKLQQKLESVKISNKAEFDALPFTEQVCKAWAQVEPIVKYFLPIVLAFRKVKGWLGGAATGVSMGVTIATNFLDGICGKDDTNK